MQDFSRQFPGDRPLPAFDDLHQWYLAEMERRARAAGSNITRVCEKTGIARATYERWGHRPPQTIKKTAEMGAEVNRLTAEAAQ